jgi:MurNAc alpha-1-phosphate uridylyltransferase
MAHLCVAFNALRHPLFPFPVNMDRDTDNPGTPNIGPGAESAAVAMLLAAGRGERMRPLSDESPKPLLEAGGRALIEWHLLRLAANGIHEVVINLGWKAEAIREALGDGRRFGVRIRYSEEGFPALDTGGGIFRALPILGSGPFLVINSDVWTDLPLDRLRCPTDSLAHLVLVPNPPHNPGGDFILRGGRVFPGGEGRRRTFSGIGIYRGTLFEGCEPGRFPLAPLLVEAMGSGRVTGELFEGEWRDIGDPPRLEALRRDLAGTDPAAAIQAPRPGST